MAIATVRDRVGAGAVLFFAFFTGLGPAGLYIGLAGTLVAAVTDRDFWLWLVRQPLFWLAVVWIGYVLLRAQLPNAYPVDPSEADDARDGLIAISGLVGLVLAWWLHDRPRLLRWILILLPVGLMLGVLVRTEPEMWHRLIYKDHRFFGHMTNSAAGLYSGAILMGCIAFGIPWLRARLEAGARILWPGLGLGLVALCCLFLFITSQSRSSWLAALVLLVLVAAVFGRARHLRVVVLSARNHPWAALVVVAITVAVATASVWIIGSRLAQEAHNWRAVLTLDWDSLERYSIGIRIALTSEGVQHIMEAPWIGLGFGTTAAALEQTGNPLLLPGNEHYHNLYLQIAGMTGLIGLAFFFGMVTLVARGALMGWRSHSAELRRLGGFVLACGVFFLVASLFQVRYNDPRGMVFIGLLTAFALVCRERNSRLAYGPASSNGTTPGERPCR